MKTTTLNPQKEITAKEAFEIIQEIVLGVKLGVFTYDEGKLRALPYMDIVNKKMAEISKKYNKRPQKISWVGLTR